MIKKLRRSLTLKYTLILSCLLIAGVFASYTAYCCTGVRLLKNGLKNYLTDEVREVGDALAKGRFSPEIVTVKSGIKSIHNFTYIFIDGEIRRAERPQNEELAHLLELRMTNGEYPSGKVYYEKITVSHPQKRTWHFLIAMRELSGGVRIFVATNSTPVRQNARAYMRNALIAVLCAIVLAYAVGGWFAGKSLKYLEQAYEKQKRFVSDAAHEFRTPLTILYSYAELLEYTSEKSEIIADIKDEIQQMSDMVDRLLAIARYDNSSTVTHPERFSATEAAQSAIQPLSALYPSGTFELNGADVEIMADKTMFRQLLRILLDNAVKYTGKNKKIDVSIAKKANTVEISVRDNGVGIKSEDLPYVFDRFWRAESARHEKGLGLGLSLAQTIVTLHGGTIRVDSAVGNGTVFTIVLPQKI